MDPLTVGIAAHLILDKTEFLPSVMNPIIRLLNGIVKLPSDFLFARFQL